MMAPELIAAALKLIGVLVVIVVAMLVCNGYFKRFLGGGAGGGGRKRMQILESTPLGLKKSITLVKVPGAVLVLGVTQDRITLLDRLDGQDDIPRADPLSSTPKIPSFHEQLRKVTGVFQRRPESLGPSATRESASC